MRLRIPSPNTLCVLYVTVNLINVKRTSIAVAVALIMLFCMRISMQVSKVKYARTHTQRRYQLGCIYCQDALDSPSNHGEVLALRKLSCNMCQLCRRHQSLKNTISWWIKYRILFNAYQDFG